MKNEKDTIKVCVIDYYVSQTRKRHFEYGNGGSGIYKYKFNCTLNCFELIYKFEGGVNIGVFQAPELNGLIAHRFDRMKIIHYHGAEMEEDHYYPFGLNKEIVDLPAITNNIKFISKDCNTMNFIQKQALTMAWNGKTLVRGCRIRRLGGGIA